MPLKIRTTLPLICLVVEIMRFCVKTRKTRKIASAQLIQQCLEAMQMLTFLSFVRSIHGRVFVRKRYKLEECELSTLLEQENIHKVGKPMKSEEHFALQNQDTETLEYMTR